MKNVSFNLRTVDVVRQNDGDDGGSDPYLFVSYFQCDASTTEPNGEPGVRVITSASSTFRSDVPNELRQGRSFTVPPSQGRQRLLLNTIGNCFTGMVVVLLEEDETSTEVVNRARSAVHEAVSHAILNEIHFNTPHFSWSSQDTQNLERSIAFSARKVINKGTGWFTDADEVVAAKARMFMGCGAIVSAANQMLTFSEGSDSTDELYRLHYDVVVTTAIPPVGGGVADVRLLSCDRELKSVSERRELLGNLFEEKQRLQARLQTAPAGAKAAIVRQIDEVAVRIVAAERGLSEIEDQYDACLVRLSHRREVATN